MTEFRVLDMLDLTVG